jgi:hypothetical protein
VVEINSYDIFDYSTCSTLFVYIVVVCNYQYMYFDLGTHIPVQERITRFTTPGHALTQEIAET